MVWPWFLVLGLSAGLAAVYVSNAGKQAELERLRSNAQELEKLETDLTHAREQASSLQTEIEALRADKQELLRLRGEVVRMRQENERLSTQARTAQTQAERAQAQATQAMQTAAQQLQESQQQNAQLRTAAGQSQATLQRNACINQLRQLDGAKQQWALEKMKTAEAVPTPQEISPYLNGLPKCPAGGTYAINAVGQLPTCTLPGHALPVPQPQ
jgi:DNA repair exonuclease SbcCD ATPase subunit